MRAEGSGAPPAMVEVQDGRLSAAGSVSESREAEAAREVAFFEHAEMDISDTSRPSSAASRSDDYSDFDSDSSDDYEEDLPEEVVQARIHDDEFRDVMHFFKLHPQLMRAQATVRSVGVHKIAQLKRMSVACMLESGVSAADAALIATELGCPAEECDNACVPGRVPQAPLVEGEEQLAVAPVAAQQHCESHSSGSDAPSSRSSSRASHQETRHDAGASKEGDDEEASGVSSSLSAHTVAVAPHNASIFRTYHRRNGC